MCGIFGYLGKDPKDFNKDKFDKLGIYNVERGKSSCGVSYDGEIYIGLDKNKLYYDFIVENNIKPFEYPIVIGHTRQSSVGAVNSYNAHPFGFDVNNVNSGFKFIGCHNGTLSNHTELAKKYNVELTADYKLTTYQNNIVDSVRTKIDSELLLEILYRSNNFKVLSEYIGGAALFWTDTDTPNVGYLWKGASKSLSSDNDSKMVEERPLFVYLENDNSMYVSSLESALKTISDDDTKIKAIDSNTVYVITDGDFKNAKKIKVSRKKAYQKEDYSTNYNKQYSGRNYSGHNYGYEDWDYDYGYKSNESTKTISPSNSVIESKVVTSNIYNETTLQSLGSYDNKVYFNKLRYLKKGLPITGIYTWIPGYGFHYLESNIKEATERFYFHIDKVFINGAFEAVNPNLKNQFIPFKSENCLNPSLFYFVEGVNLRTSIDYNIAYTRYLGKNRKYLDFHTLSSLSTHPVIDLDKDVCDVKHQNILFNGKPFSGQICPLGSEKKYVISLGNLVSSSVNTYLSKELPVEEVSEIDKVIDAELAKLDAWDNPSFMKVVVEPDSDEDILNTLIDEEESISELVLNLADEDLAESFSDFQKLKSKLEKYKDNYVAGHIIDFLDDSLHQMNNFLKI